jgi:hypothetical protein
LDISWNKIDNKGAKALAEHPNLTELNISENNIDGVGMKFLIDNLQFSHLDVSHNQGNDAINMPKEMWRKRVEAVQNYTGLSGLLSPILSSTCSLEFPQEMEKLILEYCKPLPFTFLCK